MKASRKQDIGPLPKQEQVQKTNAPDLPKPAAPPRPDSTFNAKESAPDAAAEHRVTAEGQKELAGRAANAGLYPTSEPKQVSLADLKRKYHAFGEIPGTGFGVGTTGAMSKVVNLATGATYSRQFHDATRVDDHTLLTALGDRPEEPGALKVLDLATGETSSVKDYEARTGKSLAAFYKIEGPGATVDENGRTHFLTRESLTLVNVQWPKWD
jgi:hypothetical protein